MKGSIALRDISFLEVIMNWGRFRGNWKQLTGKLQTLYGYEKDQAEKELDEFMRTLGA